MLNTTKYRNILHYFVIFIIKKLFLPGYIVGKDNNVEVITIPRKKLRKRLWSAIVAMKYNSSETSVLYLNEIKELIISHVNLLNLFCSKTLKIYIYFINEESSLEKIYVDDSIRGLEFIGISFQAGMSMWNIFHQSKMYIKNNVTIKSQWKCYMGKLSVLEIQHAPSLF